MYIYLYRYCNCLQIQFSVLAIILLIVNDFIHCFVGDIIVDYHCTLEKQEGRN